MQRRLLIKFTVLLITILLLTTPALSLTKDFMNIKDTATEVLEKLAPENIIDTITANLLSYSKDLYANFGICLAVIIISSVFSIIKSGFSSTDNIFELISCCIIITVIIAPLNLCFEKVTEHIEAICGFMISLIPTCVALHTATGNTLSAALLSTSTSTFITLIQSICATIIIPLIKASLSVTIINTICKNTNLSGVAQTLKDICLWITGLCFTLFTGFLSLQSILQAGGDNLTMKGLKYGAARLIPIAGGMVSESMKTVIVGMGYIKSVTGISGIVFIIYTVIPPLCFIMITKLYLSALSFASGLTDKGLITSFLKFSVTAVNMLLAVLISCSVSLIIILAIFIKTTVSI